MPRLVLPGRGQVQGQLQRGRSTLLERAEQALHALPLRGKQAELVGQGRGAARSWPSGRSAYVELYGAYTECEALYGVERLLALRDALAAEDRGAFGLDPRVIDWDHYVHRDPPAVGGASTPGCAPTAGRAAGERRADPAAQARCWPPSGRSRRSTSRTR